jgi:ankyrin repeat protein
MTALHYAVKQSNSELINLLLSNNADVMVQDSKGMTALHYACMKGDLPAY